MSQTGIIEFSPVAQFTIDSDHHITRWNRACELMTGRSAVEMVGTDFQWRPFYAEKRAMLADLVVSHDRKGILSLYRDMDVARSKVIPHAWEAAGFFQDIGGQARHLRFLAAPIFHVDGSIVGAVETFLDITEQKNYEQALIQSAEGYRVLAENVPDGVALMQEGKILMANHAFVRIFGYERPEDMIGMDADEAIAPSLKEQYRRTLSAIESSESRERILRWPCITKDGREIWVEGHPNPIMWKNKPAVLSTLLDITEMKNREIAAEEETQRLLKENLRLKSTIGDRYRFGDIIGKSPAMQEVYKLILKASSSDASVILYGESGTGKELVARSIHDLSKRHEGPFVAVNCGAIPETLLESEFFGHRKGSFTGAYSDKRGYLEAADGGTLFLDEIGDIPLSMQVKLLRAIEKGEYVPIGSTRGRKSSFRLISATHKHLMELVQKGTMREDFFYRIHVVPIRMPPLRNRTEDIPLLVDHFLRCSVEGARSMTLPSKIREALYEYGWPGNVRELQNALKHYLTVGRLDLLHDTPLEGEREAAGRDFPANGIGDLRTALLDLEREMITRALQKTNWNRTKAAAILGLPRKTLFRKMTKIERK